MDHSPASLLRLSRMAGAGVDPKLTDADLAILLDMFALADASGNLPGAGGYVATYDWHGAAAEAWRWKAAAASATVSFQADGSRFDASDVIANCERQAALHEAKRQTGTISL